MNNQYRQKVSFVYKYEVEEVIKRLERYPTDMSCYLNVEESIAATYIKDKFIEILREELL